MSILIIIISAVSLGGCGKPGIAGVEVITQPITEIRIDGKEAGSTPYRNNNLREGFVEIALGEEGLGTWRRSIKLNKNISTVINWTFGKDDLESGGYILSMEKINDGSSSMIVASSPSGGVVTVDGEVKGITPLSVSKLPEGDREIKIIMPDYKTIAIGLRSVKNYRILIEATLPREERLLPTLSESTQMEVPNIASKKLKITTTETGWLRVREKAETTSREIGRVSAGEEYEYFSENNGFVEIEYQGKRGFVSAKYVVKL